MSSDDSKNMVWNFRLEVGNMVPYNEEFYIITKIKGDKVTLDRYDSVPFNVSYDDLEQTIRSHNPNRKRSQSRSQSPKNSIKRGKRSRGGKKSRKKHTLKRRK